MKKRKLGVFVKVLSHLLVLMILVLPFVGRWNFVEAQALFLTVEPSFIVIKTPFKSRAQIGEGFSAAPFTTVLFTLSGGGGVAQASCETGISGSCEVGFIANTGGERIVVAKYYSKGKWFDFPPAKFTVHPPLSASADQTTIPNNKTAKITAKAPAGTIVAFAVDTYYSDGKGGTISSKTCTTSATSFCSIYFSSPNLGEYGIYYGIPGADSWTDELVINVVASTIGGGGGGVCKATENKVCENGSEVCKAGVAADTTVCKANEEKVCSANSYVCKAVSVTSEPVGINIKLINPIKANRLDEFIKDLLNIILTIGVPIVALAIIYSGFLFVKAQGKEEDLKKAKQTFFYTIIGAAILLGAWVLAQAIKGTIEQIGS